MKFGSNPNGPLLSDSDKARIAKKWESIMRKSSFMRMLAEHECRDLPPMGEQPEYQK